MTRTVLYKVISSGAIFRLTGGMGEDADGNTTAYGEVKVSMGREIGAGYQWKSAQVLLSDLEIYAEYEEN